MAAAGVALEALTSGAWLYGLLAMSLAASLEVLGWATWSGYAPTEKVR